MTLALGGLRRLWIVVPLAACLAFMGCGEKRTTSGQTEGEANMQGLMRLAAKYRAANRGALPANEAAFKKFAEGLKPAELTDLKIEDVQKVFVSPRDNQPYVILYGSGAFDDPSKAAKGNKPTGAMKPPVFAYEKTGSGGKRYLALAMGGSVIEVDETQFKEYVPNAGN